MKFPDDSPARRVKCPTCGNVFMSPDSTSASGSQERPKARPAKAEIDDRPRRRDEDDRDDRRSRDDDRSRRSRDDEDSDRDVRRRRGRDDEDDEFEDRGRRRRDREDEFDDLDDVYEQRRPRRRRDVREGPAVQEARFNRASLACLLCFIGGWLQVAGLGLLTFVVFLAWVGVDEGLKLFVVLGGILGLGHWLTSTTGIGFLISGPRKNGALGLAIATTCTAGLHLLLVIILATSKNVGAGTGVFGANASDIDWSAFITVTRALPNVLFFSIGLSELAQGRGSPTDGALLPIFTNLVEVARWVLLLLTFRAIMMNARDSRGASLCMKTMVGYSIGAGGIVVLGIIFGLIFLALGPGKAANASRGSFETVIYLQQLLTLLVLVGMSVWTTLVVKMVKGNIDYRRD